MAIGGRLRKRRVEMDLSRNKLAEMVHVTPSAIANYENGVSYPKPDILISLIIALEVDANYLYQDYLSNNTIRRIYGNELSEEEKEAVAKYRYLTKNGKRLVRMIIDEEYMRIQAEDWTTLPCWQPGSRVNNTGFILQDMAQTIRIPKMYLPGETDFCLQIQIDRYEPIFQKYDVIAVKGGKVKHNEMGIFSLNDVCYIRVLCKDGDSIRLRALNVMDPEIEVAKDDRFRCIGKVLGKVYGTYEIKDN